MSKGLLNSSDGSDLSVMLIGVVLVVLPLSFFTPKAAELGVEASIKTSSLIFLYGVSTIIGGFTRGEAKYFGYFVDISALLGVALAITGPILQVIETGLWMKIAVVGFIFISIPSTVGERVTRRRGKPE